MCAICGVYYHDPSRQVERSLVERMARSMRHRGPDGEGFHLDRNVGLGHQRLSIIDLSPRGAQPMTNEDGDADGIFGQMFDSSGSPIGGEFQVSTYTTNDQYGARVAVLIDALPHHQ